MLTLEPISSSRRFNNDKQGTKRNRIQQYKLKQNCDVQQEPNIIKVVTVVWLAHLGVLRARAKSCRGVATCNRIYMTGFCICSEAEWLNMGSSDDSGKSRGCAKCNKNSMF